MKTICWWFLIGSLIGIIFSPKAILIFLGVIIIGFTLLYIFFLRHIPLKTDKDGNIIGFE